MSGPLTNARPRRVKQGKLEIPPSFPQPQRFEEILQEMRNRRTCIDLILKSKTKKFPCHKDIIGLYSNHIRKQLGDSGKVPAVVSIMEMSDDIVEAILNWMYAPGSEAHRFITSKNLQEVMEGAAFLEIRELHELCQNIITQTNDPIMALKTISNKGNAITPALFIHLQGIVLTKIRHYFNKDSFNSLTAEDLQYLLLQNQLEVENEVEVLDAIVTWLKLNWANRRQHMEVLLKAVRYANIEPSSLVILQHSSKYKSYLCSSSVNDLVQDAIKYGVIKEKYGKDKKKYQKRMQEHGLFEPEPRKYLEECVERRVQPKAAEAAVTD